MRAHETHERAARHGGFPPHGFASGLLAACPSDGSHDFYLSMMLDVPVPRVPMLRARLQDSRRGVPHERERGRLGAQVRARGRQAQRCRSRADVSGERGRRRGAQRASDAQEAGRVVQVQREHGQTPPVMAGSERLIRRGDHARPGISASGTGPSCGICAWGTVWSSIPTSSTRTTSTRPEVDGLPRKQGEGKPRLTCGPWLWRRGHGETPAHG